jgi:penicillin-insensitive murein endopeptidase
MLVFVRRTGLVLCALVSVIAILSVRGRADEVEAAPSTAAIEPAAPVSPAETARLARASRAADGHGEPSEAILAALPRPPSVSMSVGRPNRGFLRFGIAARVDDPNVLLKKPDGPGRYATRELLDLLHFAAGRVAARFPSSQLFLGDLSRRHGGRFRPHKSHRTGRDADVGFYLRDTDGHDARPPQFVRIGRSGAGSFDGHRYVFDVERNWALIEALLSHEQVALQHVFIARSIRDRLLRHARSQGAHPEIVARAALVLHQPSRGLAHHTHFHVRIYCPLDDRPRCVDVPPLFDWYPAPRSENAPVALRRDRREPTSVF